MSFVEVAVGMHNALRTGSDLPHPVVQHGVPRAVVRIAAKPDR